MCLKKCQPYSRLAKFIPHLGVCTLMSTFTILLWNYSPPPCLIEYTNDVSLIIKWFSLWERNINHKKYSGILKKLDQGQISLKMDTVI